MVYGALGTVTIAQIAQRIDELPVDVQILLHVMLLVAFGIKVIRRSVGRGRALPGRPVPGLLPLV